MGIIAIVPIDGNDTDPVNRSPPQSRFHDKMATVAGMVFYV